MGAFKTQGIPHCGFSLVTSKLLLVQTNVFLLLFIYLGKDMQYFIFSREFLQREVFYKGHWISSCGDSWLLSARVWDCASWTLEIQPLPWPISSLHWLLQSVIQENCQVLRLGPKQWGRFPPSGLSPIFTSTVSASQKLEHDVAPPCMTCTPAVCRARYLC